MQVLNQSLHSQRMRLLEQLRIKPISTIEARHELDILGVGPRIFELRHHFGYNIVTQRIEAKNPGGGKHKKIALYVLMSDKYEKGGKANVN